MAALEQDFKGQLGLQQIRNRCADSFSLLVPPLGFFREIGKNRII
jgi:hypothetical protein